VLLQLGIPVSDDGSTLEEAIAEMQGLFDTGKLYKTEIDGLVNSYRAKVSRLLENEALLQLASNVEVAVALADSAANAQLSAEQAASAAKQLIPFSVDLDWGPLLIAHYLYDDPNRADEIVALNPPTDFFYPKGTILRVPDR
jgi:prophage DNA circulation protein